MDILLIRHGQSHNNAVFAAQGHALGRLPDPPLTALGHAQARALAAAMVAGDWPVVPTALHCSLMSRAVQTAAPIAEALGLEVHGHAELFEVGGPLDWSGDDADPRRAHPGSAAADLSALTPRLVLPSQAQQDGWWAGPVEAGPQSVARAARVVAWLRERYARSDEVVALVSHEGFSHVLFRELLGIPAVGGWIDLNNTGGTYFRAVDTPGRTSVAWTNRTTHLTSDQISG
ncbi:MAG: histidine phosphatase family protein [Actinomycetales bacterium]|nr:histidine phosphatase family protein [Actinomycetales bacterium]